MKTKVLGVVIDRLEKRKAEKLEAMIERTTFAEIER